MHSEFTCKLNIEYICEAKVVPDTYIFSVTYIEGGCHHREELNADANIRPALRRKIWKTLHE